MRDRLIELIQLAKIVEQVAPTYDDIGRNMIFANFLINNGVTVQEWISVKDRLPKHGDVVMVWHQYIKQSYVCQWDDVEGLWIDSMYTTFKQHEISCWMPLPQPPKGE